MIALTISAVAVTAIAFIFCTTVGVKMVMEDSPGMMLCVGNIMRLVG